MTSASVNTQYRALLLCERGGLGAVSVLSLHTRCEEAERLKYDEAWEQLAAVRGAETHPVEQGWGVEEILASTTYFLPPLEKQKVKSR